MKSRRTQPIVAALCGGVILGLLLSNGASATRLVRNFTASGGPIANLTFDPSPIAAHGSMAAGHSVVVAVTTTDTNGNVLPGATVYLSFRPALGGGTASAQGQGLTSSPQSFQADSNGNLAVTYGTPAALPTQGTDVLTAQDSPTSPTVSATDTYAFTVGSGVSQYVFSLNPLAMTSTLAAGQTVNGTVTAETASGSPVAGATVYMSFRATPGGGTAKAFGVALVANSAPFLTGPAGTIKVFYTTPSALPSIGTDTIKAAEKRVGSAISASDSYTFGVTGYSPPIIPWAPQSEDPNSSTVAVPPAQAVVDAQNFQYLTAHPAPYQASVAAMKQTNPKLALLVYMNATFAQKNQAAFFPQPWYLLDSQGRKVTATATGDFLMNPASSGWIANRIAECQNLLSQSGYDGCSLDVLGQAPLSTPYVSAQPINPATNQPWTPAAWLPATSGLAGQIRAAISPRLVFGNGLSNGPAFYKTGAPTSQILNGVDGGIAEAWLRPSRAAANAFPSELTWLQNVNMIGDTEATGKPLLTILKLWVTATGQQTLQWDQYGLASYLLGTQGKSAYFFSANPNGNRTNSSAWYATKLGAPSGPFAKIGGVYQRAFATGKVLVNPTTASVTVSLGGTYVDLQGVSHTSVTMTPDTGLLLVLGSALPGPTTVVRHGSALPGPTTVAIGHPTLFQSLPAGPVTISGSATDIQSVQSVHFDFTNIDTRSIVKAGYAVLDTPGAPSTTWHFTWSTPTAAGYFLDVQAHGAGGQSGLISTRFDLASTTGPAFLTLLLGRAQVGESGSTCSLLPHTVSIEGVAATLKQMGKTASGAVIVDRTAETTQTCVAGGLYPSWQDLATMRDQDGFTFVSAGVSYVDNRTLTQPQQLANICGSLPAFEAHGHTRAWGLFAYPNADLTQAMQTGITANCFAYGRTYAPGRSHDDVIGTSPWLQHTNSITGGACNNIGLPCYSINVIGPNGQPTRYQRLDGLKTLMATGPGEWTTVQFYKFVTGAYNASATSGARWDCSSTDWHDHWTAIPETYCWKDFLVAVTSIPAGVTVTDPATVAQTLTPDSTLPNNTIQTGPADPTIVTTATFTFVSDDPRTWFWCSLDGGAGQLCTSGQTYQGLTSGSHTFTVTGTDAYGNVGNQATWSWSIL